MMPVVIAVEQTGPYRLRLRFDDGAEGELDIKEYLPFDGVFEPLRDPAYFARVRVDADAGTIVWPNGADLDPWVLHSRVTGVPIVFDDGELAEEVDGASAAPEPGHDVQEISRFLGIVVGMSCDEHAAPHFHARYGRASAVIEVPHLGLLRNTLPPRAVGFLMEWASQHRDELMQDWELARSGRPLKRIPPLE